MKRLHIFKAGQHTDMGGHTLNFGEADLVATARAYDPDLHEAPMVIGHPKTDAPAHGWIGALSVDKDGLRAMPRQIDAAFADQVRAGSYKKLSASFYAPDSPNNPVPGVYYLRHVGFLGAQPPAVKGLDKIELADGETGVVSFEEGDGEASPGLFQALRQWLVKHKGQEAADQLLSADAVKELAGNDADSDGGAGDDTELTDDTTADDLVAELTEKLTAQGKRLEALEKEKSELESARAEQGSAESTSFVERLIKNGRLQPRHRDAVVAFMEVACGRASQTEDGVLSFGEGDAAKPLLPAFRAFLSGLPKAVDFGETATKRRASQRAGANPLVADAERRAKSH